MGKADRNIIYSFIQSALDDAQLHLDSAFAFAGVANDLEAAIDRCLRARDAIREAQEEIVVSSELVTRQKQTIFEREITSLYQRLWCVTKDVSSKTRLCYTEHQKSRVLRMHFLAYSYEPQEAEAVGG